MARFVITGGTGFVGASLANALRALGHDAILASRGRHLHAESQYWVEYDLVDAATVANIVEAKPDGIFHLAWSTTPGSAENDPAADAKTNLGGLLALFQQVTAKLSVPVVFVSSGGTVYGKARTLPITEDHPLDPVSIYGITKLAAENYASRFWQLQGLDVRIARLSNPFGVSQSIAKLQGAATIFARQVVLGEKVTIWGDGSVVRDYIDVADSASALIGIMMAEVTDEHSIPTFNVGSGEGASLNELLRIIGDAAGREPNVSYVGGRAFDIPANILDISKIKKATGWQPRQNMKNSIQEMVQNLAERLDSQ
ncbi:NAD-dependent epimerase/dehydratase family protein [Phyllobacterium sp. BT25]|uniref:UDP-glucose 4-epimerase n=1 Tax=Phyllobacterium pellucidum TaxID=2740464 RepID=A0A849VPD5_9HYPH|nr:MULTISPECIES: NAD-dependent epimerase/dehydratase family protein [Phyllobacterium]NTS30619.1 NAD-dependent epimerase/dehydratase family protein [Phyllobacterium pellucidum]UGY10672.1 NAD-dependent epimerase/dehydratase family protein [Phyllobacterium sp. T1018]